jgi:hypothetical protein
MKNNDWRGLAELIGIAAIVASLLFVGYQLKQDREIAISSAYQARAFEAAEQIRRAADNENVVRGNIRALFSIDPDDPPPRGRFPSAFDGIPAKEMYASVTMLSASWFIYENSHYQYTKGFLPVEHWQRIRLIIKENLQNDPFLRLSLNFYRPPAGFQIELDSIVEELDVETAEQ